MLQNPISNPFFLWLILAIPPKFKNAYPANIYYPNGASGAPSPPLYTSSCLKFPTTEIFNCEAM